MTNLDNSTVQKVNIPSPSNPYSILIEPIGISLLGVPITVPTGLLTFTIECDSDSVLPITLNDSIHIAQGGSKSFSGDSGYVFSTLSIHGGTGSLIGVRVKGT